MQKILLQNIKGLVQINEDGVTLRKGEAMSHLPILEDAYLLIENDKISDYGTMSQLPIGSRIATKVIDCSGKYVFPSFVDSHTHIVFAGSRENEFVDKIKGLSYEEIAKKGGGILNSAKKLQATAEDELLEGAYQRLQEVIRTGTGAIEIKSGYGLTVQDELKMLRVVRELKKISPIAIKATFLGAHTVPKDVERSVYIQSILNEMLPQVVEENLAEFCDVFCDVGFYTVEETDLILQKATALGLTPKIHANELGISGGVQVGIKNKALSVDHLERIGVEEVEALVNSQTLPTLLPATALFLGLPHPPARQLMQAGLPVVLASDFNPGSCPTGNMPLVAALGCILLKMTPEEAINATTINAAAALQLSATHGSIRKGATANLFITRTMPSIAFMPYSFGTNPVETVILNGKIV